MLPISVAYEVTYRCNHRCLFCSCPWYAPESSYRCGEELSVDEWNRVTDLLLNQGVTSFSISGGEALMKEGLVDILTHIRRRSNERGIRNQIVLISNGRLMSDEWLEEFKRLNVHLSMSLPGYSTFNTLTGVQDPQPPQLTTNNSAQQETPSVLHWFGRAKALGLSTTANITVTKINIHELYETIAVALLAGANDILLNRFLPGGRGLVHLDALKLTPAEVIEMLNTAEEVLTIANRYGNVGTEIPLCLIRGRESKGMPHLHVGFRCAAAKGFFVVDPSGQIRTCNHSPRVVGHIFGEPMIRDLEYWNLFALGACKPSTCKDCEDLKKCDCGCREVANILNGSPYAVDTSIM